MVRYQAGTVYVYEGPISLNNALQAAEEGRPNPLSEEQLAEGLGKGQKMYPMVPVHLMAVKNSFWFGKLFVEQFEWDVREAGRSANFEPRYLQALVISHQYEVKITYGRVLNEYAEDPAAFEAKLDWGSTSSR